MFRYLIFYIKKNFSILKNKNVSEKFYQELEGYQQQLKRNLFLSNPFYENQEKYEEAVIDFKNNQTTIQTIKTNLKSYEELSKISSCKIDKKGWLSEIGNQKRYLKNYKNNKNIEIKLNANLKEINYNLLKQWKKDLDSQYKKWEQNEIEKTEKELLKKFKEWLEKLQKIQEILENLSLNLTALFSIFDLSKDNISLQNIEEIKYWSKYVSQNEQIKNLCDMLGKLRKEEKKLKKEKYQFTKIIKKTIKETTSKEEISGIKFSNNLEYLLPVELALLGDETTSLLFAKKFIEGELMNFDMEGFANQSIKIKETKINEKQKAEKNKLGPMIICVDTSSSMAGTPETVAKAITLYMASKAMQEKRDCYLINFSTKIETIDLSYKLGIGDLISFLKKSFHGGTDLNPALKDALKTMTDKRYKNSDLLAISDFIIPPLPDKLKKEIQLMKKNGNKFYSLIIKSQNLETNPFFSAKNRDFFDEEWSFNLSNTDFSDFVLKNFSD